MITRQSPIQNKLISKCENFYPKSIEHVALSKNWLRDASTLGNIATSY